MESEGAFANAMEQAEAVRRNARGAGSPQQTVEVWIQVSTDRKTWHDAELFWSGSWKPATEGGIPGPEIADLIRVGRKYGARYAQHNVRSTI